MTSRTLIRSFNRSKLLPALLASAGLIALAGCHPGDYRATFKQSASSSVVELAGADLSEASVLAFDIKNDAGTVLIDAEPWRTTTEVTARVRWEKGDHGFTDENLPGSVVANTEIVDGRATVHINATLAENAPENARIDLVIKTPPCDGVQISNAGGAVVATGIGGAITIENGLNGKGGGRIEVRTNRDLIDPVALITTEGRVSMILPPNSTGALDLETEEGEATFSTPFGTVGGVKSGYGTWQGVYNKGENQIKVRSGAGKIWILVDDDPESYTVADGFAGLFD